MSLKDDLKKASVEAAKARDQIWLDTIRSIQSGVHYKEIEKRSALNDTEILGVIKTLCKQRREAIESFEKGGRQDLADKEKREFAILEKFLPEQLSREEIEKIVRRVIGETGAKGPSDMGKVMKAALADLAGKADGKLVSEIVKGLLQ